MSREFCMHCGTLKYFIHNHCETCGTTNGGFYKKKPELLDKLNEFIVKTEKAKKSLKTNNGFYKAIARYYNDLYEYYVSEK
jgi:heterodisulfide reductase subunit B